MSILNWIQDWYRKECNGDWEHSYGIKIETIDNPGWAIFIDLRDTNLEGISSIKKEVDNGENDWYVYSIESNQYKAFGDSTKLEFLLIVFKQLIENK